MDFSKLGELGLRLFEPTTILLAALVFWPLERVLPDRTNVTIPGRAGWRTDVTYLILNGAFVRLLMLPVALGLGLLIHVSVPGAVSRAVQAQPVWLQLIEAILAADLGFYLMHRLCHAWPVLWRFHAVHHSIEDLDWMASFRVHPVDQVLSAAAALTPLLILGFSDWTLAGYALIYRWHSILLHSNLRLPMGRVGLLIATPEFHRWHHSTERQAWDRNFAGQIAVWDVIFRTAYLPRDRQSAGSGLQDSIPGRYVDQLAYPFRRSRRQPDAVLSESA